MRPTHSVKSYRPDIDGLRAVAVMSVVFYHANVPHFGGGYLGVDVFFVISGYLITRVIDAAAEDSWTARLKQFYLRRARRILPALLVMLAVTAAVATLLYFPSDLRNFGRSLALSTAFLGNFAAAQDGGYFDPGERFTPLRHLWSLGVEEQFYLLYPLALAFLGLFNKGIRLAALMAAVLFSLLLSYWGAVHSPVLNFYMFPTRAWELLLGALVAAWPAPTRDARKLHELFAAIGFVGLLSVLWNARIIGFPGTAAPIACASTALLIIGNSRPTITSRILGIRPLVFIGLISYSLYLWHAPILDFFAYWNVTAPSAPQTMALILASLIVAALSWEYVEQPFRYGHRDRRNAPFVTATLGSSLILAGAGGLLLQFQGFPQRLSVDVPRVAADPAQVFDEAGRCSRASPASIADGELCSFGPAMRANQTVVVWGDSHASVLLPIYRDLARDHHLKIYYGIRGACRPLPGFEAASAGEFWRRRCAEFNAAMMHAIEKLAPDLIILNAYWADPGGAGEPEFQKRLARPPREVSEEIRRSLLSLQAPGRSLCAVLTVPGYEYPIPYALAMAHRRDLDEEQIGVGREDALAQYRIIEGGLRAAANEGLLRLSDPKELFCTGERCSLVDSQGQLLYRDANHLSITGAALLRPTLEACLTT